MTSIFVQNNDEKYNCINCNFKCSKNSDWLRHLITRKHENGVKILTTTDENGAKNASNIHICNCGKEYKHRQSLYNHKKKCNKKDLLDDIKKDTDNKDDLINYLIKENQEFKNLILEIVKKDTNNISNNNNNNTNSHNKTFNLQFFLNETCKDALNITEFVNSIQLQLEDLENTAKKGYVSGISNIIIKELKDLDINKRPIHCSDLKRETIYIKDNNTWEKENEEKEKMKQVIQEVTNKNVKQIPSWLEGHPKAFDYYHPDNEEYMQLLISCMPGSSKEEQEENVKKIMKNLSKEVVIDK